MSTLTCEECRTTYPDDFHFCPVCTEKREAKPEFDISRYIPLILFCLGMIAMFYVGFVILPRLAMLRMIE